MNRPATPDLADLALTELTRRHERAVIDLANRRVQADRANRNLCAWAAIAVLAGADLCRPGLPRDLRPAGDLLADARRWWANDPATARAVAADWIAPAEGWHPHLAHAVTQAIELADRGPRETEHALHLRRLAHALGLTGPFSRAIPAQAERKAA